MRIAITKRPATLKQASYALLASNITAAGVWFGDEHHEKAKSAHESLGKTKKKKASFDA